MRMRSNMMLAGPLVLLAGLVTAQGPATHTVDDPSLQWGDCPEFLPAGCRIAVLNGDPAQPNADIFFSVPAQSRIARHWHSSAERMVLVAGELEVNYDGADPVTLRPGTYAYGPARAPHEARCVSKDACVLFIAFEGPVDAVAGDPPDA
jgi:quercetin dioxygenase-like cupin family protein